MIRRNLKILAADINIVNVFNITFTRHLLKLPILYYYDYSTLFNDFIVLIAAIFILLFSAFHYLYISKKIKKFRVQHLESLKATIILDFPSAKRKCYLNFVSDKH
jgi:hypothetical protein